MLMRSAPLNRQQDGAAPLPADADALYETEESQDDRSPDADAVIGRHERHQERRDSHQHQRCDQRPFAADTIAVMAENDCPDRPRNETDRIDTEGLQRSG